MSQPASGMSRASSVNRSTKYADAIFIRRITPSKQPVLKGSPQQSLSRAQYFLRPSVSIPAVFMSSVIAISASSRDSCRFAPEMQSARRRKRSAAVPSAEERSLSIHSDAASPRRMTASEVSSVRYCGGSPKRAANGCVSVLKKLCIVEMCAFSNADICRMI